MIGQGKYRLRILGGSRNGSCVSACKIVSDYSVFSAESVGLSEFSKVHKKRSCCKRVVELQETYRNGIRSHISYLKTVDVSTLLKFKLLLLLLLLLHLLLLS